MDKKKRTILIIVGAIEIAIILFSLIVSIMVITAGNAGTPEANLRLHGPFIGWLLNHYIWYFVLFVLPLLIIFVVDGVYLIMFANKKESSLSAEDKEAIAEEAKRQAKEEVLRELREEAAREAAAAAKSEDTPSDN